MAAMVRFPRGTLKAQNASRTKRLAEAKEVGDLFHSMGPNQFPEAAVPALDGQVSNRSAVSMGGGNLSDATAKRGHHDASLQMAAVKRARTAAWTHQVAEEEEDEQE